MLFALILAASAFASAKGDLPAYLDPIDATAKALYGPFIGAKKGHFLIERNAASELVVAGARRNTVDEYAVIFDHGFLKSPNLTPDAYRFALCHEIGHLLGGAPRRPPPAEWEGPVHEDGLMLMSGEGQADYYATRVCFARMVEGEDHAAALKGKEVPLRLKAACDETWGKDSDLALVCERGAIGSYEMLRMVAPFKISLNKRDEEIVEKTLVVYPSRQCRLDTAVAGALCREESGLELDAKDPGKHGCGTGAGARPACWFKR